MTEPQASPDGEARRRAERGTPERRRAERGTPERSEGGHTHSEGGHTHSEGGHGHDGDFDWLLTDFVERVPGVAHAVVVSADGLPMARSSEVPADRADQLAAITSGLNSLTSGASRVFQGGPVEQTVIEMRHGTFLVTAVGQEAALSVLTAPTSDMGLVSYEMALLVERVGRGMAPAARTPEHEPR